MNLEIFSLAQVVANNGQGSGFGLTYWVIIGGSLLISFLSIRKFRSG